MAAVVLSLTLSFIAAVLAWFAVGPRLRLSEDPKQNEVLNVFAYVALAFPVVFGIVFFVVERL